MDNNIYVAPYVEVLNIDVERGFASSGIDVDVNPWEDGPSWGDHNADEL